MIAHEIPSLEASFSKMEISISPSHLRSSILADWAKMARYNYCTIHHTAMTPDILSKVNTVHSTAYETAFRSSRAKIFLQHTLPFETTA